MKKIWNHAITVGDYVKFCAIVYVLMIPYYIWVMSRYGINVMGNIGDFFDKVKAKIKSIMYRGKREAH